MSVDGDNAFWLHTRVLSVHMCGSKAGYLRKARIESKRIKTEIRPRLEERKEWRKRGRKWVKPISSMVSAGISTVSGAAEHWPAET